MNETNLFSEPTKAEAEPKEYLKELVGEGKKFKDAEELAKGKYNSDIHIKVLETRFDEMKEDYLKLKEDYESRAKLEELVTQYDQMLAKGQQSSSQTTPRAKEDVKPAVDMNEFRKAARSEYEALKQAETERANFNQVQATLKEHLGENYQAVLKERMEELDLDPDFVNQLAKTKPQVLYKTLGLDTKQAGETFQSPLKSVQRSDSFTPKSTKRDLAYYQELRKKNPNLYLDRKIAIQMDKDAQALGDAFFGTSR